MFADVDIPRLYIAIDLRRDLVATGPVVIGCNHFLGICFGCRAVGAQLLSGPSAEQFVTKRLYLEVRFLNVAMLILEILFAVFKLVHLE